MTHYSRLLNLKSLLTKKSIFLFGPRSTGKTTLIHDQLSKAVVYDLLDPNTFSRLLRRPQLISEENENPKNIIVIDEIQKLPQLLDVIHSEIEKKNKRFLLTGSSARKLKRGASNLLGGRAWEAHLFPLTSHEISDFNLLQYINRGGIPSIYQSKDYLEEIHGYISLYLKEEVLAEAYTRNIEYFSRFLDVMGLHNGEELYYQGFSSDSGVPARTLQNYVQILEDTLVGFQLYPYLTSRKRKAITRSKFYFFDIGVVNLLAKRGKIENKSELFGRVFEHFLLLEIRAYLSYQRKREALYYWRTASGMEVDCIIGQTLALEFKSTDLATEKHLKGLLALKEEGKIKNFALVSQDETERKIGSIIIYPWKVFLKKLWEGKIIL